jgi:hypothetical protein
MSKIMVFLYYSSRSKQEIHISLITQSRSLLSSLIQSQLLLHQSLTMRTQSTMHLKFLRKFMDICVLLHWTRFYFLLFSLLLINVLIC